MAYFAEGEFKDDPFATTTVFTWAGWQEHRTEPALPASLALQLEPGFAVETLADDLSRFALIKIDFPKFTDGRGYSMAWLLRTRLGYKGQIRATGDVLFDEMQLMSRCGFDAFEISDPSTLDLLRSGRRPLFDRFYQPGLEPEVPAGTRPWIRRSA